METKNPLKDIANSHLKQAYKRAEKDKDMAKKHLQVAQELHPNIRDEHKFQYLKSYLYKLDEDNIKTSEVSTVKSEHDQRNETMQRNDQIIPINTKLNEANDLLVKIREYIKLIQQNEGIIEEVDDKKENKDITYINNKKNEEEPDRTVQSVENNNKAGKSNKQIPFENIKENTINGQNVIDSAKATLKKEIRFNETLNEIGSIQVGDVPSRDDLVQTLSKRAKENVKPENDIQPDHMNIEIESNTTLNNTDIDAVKEPTVTVVLDKVKDEQIMKNLTLLKEKEKLLENLVKEIKMKPRKRQLSDKKFEKCKDLDETRTDESKILNMKVHSVVEDDLEEAIKCIKIAQRALVVEDVAKAERFLSKAERLSPYVKPTVMGIQNTIDDKRRRYVSNENTTYAPNIGTIGNYKTEDNHLKKKEDLVYEATRSLSQDFCNKYDLNYPTEVDSNINKNSKMFSSKDIDVSKSHEEQEANILDNRKRYVNNCIKIALDASLSGDLDKAKTYFLKAQKIDPVRIVELLIKTTSKQDKTFTNDSDEKIQQITTGNETVSNHLPSPNTSIYNNGVNHSKQDVKPREDVTVDGNNSTCKDANSNQDTLKSFNICAKNRQLDYEKYVESAFIAFHEGNYNHAEHYVQYAKHLNTGTNNEEVLNSLLSSILAKK